VKHYSHAMLGIRCAFLPDAPELTGFFPKLILQSVLEYRAYALVIPFVVILARLAPWELLAAVTLAWFLISAVRLETFRSPLEFWQRLWEESHHPRIRLHFTEELIREIERKQKRGADAGREIALAGRLISETVRHGGGLA